MGSTDIATSKYRILILTLVPRFAVLQKHIGPLSCELADQTNLWLFIFFPKRFFCSITNTLYLVQSVESLCNHMYTYIFIIRTCVCCTLYRIISYFKLNENSRCTPPLYQSTQVKHYSSDVFTRNCNWKNEKVFVIIYSILSLVIHAAMKLEVADIAYKILIINLFFKN